ncbi:MAG: hypothetical protein JNM88_11045, partial [Chitinophagaceae bacterium]|nr:hypothetical protein [Chitinophagaceae bacterium]
MKKNTYHHLLMLLTALCSTIFLQTMQAQDCGCPGATMDRIEQVRDNNDSAALQKLMGEWRNSSNKNCRVFAFTLDVWQLISNRKIDTVLSIIQEQEKYVNSLPCKEQHLTQAYLNYTRYYKRKNDFENMSVWVYKALQHAEAQKDREGELQAVKDLVYLFTRQNEDEKIPAYVKRAEKIIAGLPENYLTGEHYNWLAFEYETWYTREQRMSLVDSGAAFADKAIVFSKKYQDPEQLTQSFRAFEAFSYHRGNLRQAVAYMDSALFYARQIKVNTSLGSLYLAKSSDLLDLGEKEEAMRWTDSSIFYAEKDFKHTPGTVNVYLQASQIYEAAGNLPKAFAVFKTYEHLKDSLFTLQRSEKINELEQQYNKVKNEKTIKELAQQKRIYILLALAGLLALIGLIFFIRQQSLRNKQKILETEQRL